MNTWVLHHEDGTTSEFEAASASFGPKSADFYSKPNMKGELVRRIFDWKQSSGSDIWLGKNELTFVGSSA